MTYRFIKIKTHHRTVVCFRVRTGTDIIEKSHLCLIDKGCFFSGPPGGMIALAQSATPSILAA